MLKRLFKRIWKGVKKMAEKVNEGAKKVVETVKKAADYKAEAEVKKVDIVEKSLRNIKHIFSDTYNCRRTSLTGMFIGGAVVLVNAGLYLSTYIKDPREV